MTFTARRKRTLLGAIVITTAIVGVVLVIFGVPKPNARRGSKDTRTKVGGLKDREVDDFVKRACNSFKGEVIEKAQKDVADFVVGDFNPVQAKSQVVTGTNFFVKVQVGGEQFVHLRIWERPDSSIALSDVQFGKKESDELVYF